MTDMPDPMREPLAEPNQAEETPREKIVAAFLTLLADTPIEKISLPQVAATAGVTLADLRGEFSSTLGMLAAHVRETDKKVLEADFADMAGEPARERLFDVLMKRLEVLGPHRAAIRSLMRSVRQNPPLALALNGMAVNSQSWMLAAAEIETSGPRGMVRAQGAAMLFANVLWTWVDDEEPGSARTLAALDRELARAQSMIGVVEGFMRVPEAACRFLGGLRRRGGSRRRERFSDGRYPDENFAA